MIQGILHSISGMLRATRKNEVTAHNIANMGTAGFDPLRTDSEGNVVPGNSVSTETLETANADLSLFDRPDTVSSNVDPSVEMTNMILNQRAFEANVNALKRQNEALGDLLDLAD